MNLNPNDIDYKAIVGYHYNNPDNIANISDSEIGTCIAYAVEVAVIHTENLKQNLLYCEGINASPNQYGTLTYDQYLHKYTTKGGSLKTAVNATDLLKQCGYENNSNCKKEKEKSIVLLNLWSPVIDYKEYGKSFIVLDPFEHDIYDTLGRMCSRTNKLPRSSKGEILSTKRLLRDFIIERYKKALLDPSIKKRDPWKTSTVVYRKRPDLEAKGLNPTRKYIQGLVKIICEELEELRLVQHKMSRRQGGN